MTDSTPTYPITDSIWCEVLADRGTYAGRPALFLDRDGVIVEEVDYLCRVEDVRLVPGAAETIAEANWRGIPVIVITNQGGIALGKFDWPQFAVVQAAILEQLQAQGARLDAVFACPYHPRGLGDLRHPRHPDRKPEPGMLYRSQRALGIDLHRSWIVGDKVSDIQAGQAAGLAGGMLVQTGHGEALESQTGWSMALRIAPSIAGAADLLAALAG